MRESPLSLRLPGELRRLLQHEATKDQVSLASLIVRACWQYLESPTSGGRVDSGPDTSQAGASLSVAGATPTPCAKPNMDALRAIAAGKIGKVEVESAIDSCALGIQDALSDCPDPCSHIEYCEDDGESYHCALIAGHKGKCKRGDRV